MIVLGLLVLFGGLAWEDVFQPERAAPHLYLRAETRDAAGATHELELFRDGRRRMRRLTDGRLDILVDGARVVVTDHGRRVRHELTRDQLARMGVFLDGEALAGFVARPRGRYRLEALARPASRVAGARCVWYRLDAHEICWSAALGVPLVVDDVFRVTEVFTP